MAAGRPSRGITKERVAKLDQLGFEWSPPKGVPDEVGWEVMRTKLVAFKAMPGHGHCRVPAGWPADPKLARWVRHQRTAKKRLDAGRPSPGITDERMAKLDELGFEWSPGGAR